ncbi:DUF5050 domain-containing protein [Clostridium estertheticum]|uniref:DUF5050 domain-containing protein n=1 Tax=Clostridium estertheticum TaxID=238834 RepID=UPI001CF21238|nr:DUF5050 domain-containing protein [Clostridium estertheticum]MCB2342549.1 DUF5050 domain-containing protein [Clostridium estertheticum]
MKHNKSKFIIVATIIILLIAKINITYAAVNDGQVVKADKTWTIKFNKEILWNSQAQNAIVVINSKGENVKVSLSIGNDTKSILVKPPVENYIKGEKYTLKVGNDIVAKEDGKSIIKNIEMVFYISEGEIISNMTLPNEDEIKAGNYKIDMLTSMIEYKGYIYYKNNDDWSTLYRMKNDGSDIKKVADFTVLGYMWLDGHNIYFHNMLGISKFDLDSSSKSPQNVNVKQGIINGINTSYVSEHPTNMMVKNDWIYFIDQDEEKGLYKMKSDATGKAKLTEGALEFKIDGDWLYYKDDKKHLNKIKLDGSNDSQISTDEIMSFYVLGDWIFYTNYDANCIKKVKTDGSSITNVVFHPQTVWFNIEWFTIIEDSLYYSSSDDVTNYKMFKVKTNVENNSAVPEVVDSNYCAQMMSLGDSRWYKTQGKYFSKMNINGTNKVTLDKQYTKVIGADKDWINYIEYGQKNASVGKNYKIKADGSEKTLLLKNTTDNAILDGDYIYYTSGMEIHKCNKDGTNDITIIKESGFKTNYDIKIDGEWIYYGECHNEFDDYKSNLFRAKKDGSSQQLVTDQYVSLVAAADGWVYYNSTIEYPDNLVYRIRGDGTGVEKVGSVNKEKFELEGDYIYYITASNCLYKRKLGSSGVPILIYGNINYNALSIAGIEKGYVYLFTSEGEEKSSRDIFSLKKISLKDDKCTTITEVNGIGIDIKDGVIYYMADATKWVQLNK